MTDTILEKEHIMNAKTAVTTIDINRIMEMIPHRYPFLLIDKVIDVVAGESATGIKNVTINEPFFMGHFPQRPVMPGVLIIEAMAQTCGVVVIHSMGKAFEGKLVYFMSVDEARFRKPVGPGDTLHIKVLKNKSRGTIWRFICEAFVEDIKCAEAIVTAMIVDE